LIGFAEKVMYKLPGKGPQHDEHGNISDRWLPGIFLGYRRDSNSYVMATDEGIVISRATQRKPLENRWDEAAISGITATPWSTRTRRAAEVRFDTAVPSSEPKADPLYLDPRRLKLELKDFQEHGFTAECRQCDYLQQHGRNKGGLQHT
jgi:hypothetical protein